MPSTRLVSRAWVSFGSGLERGCYCPRAARCSQLRLPSRPRTEPIVHRGCCSSRPPGGTGQSPGRPARRRPNWPCETIVAVDPPSRSTPSSPGPSLRLVREPRVYRRPPDPAECGLAAFTCGGEEGIELAVEGAVEQGVRGARGRPFVHGRLEGPERGNRADRSKGKMEPTIRLERTTCSLRDTDDPLE